MEERRKEAYCENCEMFCHLDDAGCCVECGQKILRAEGKTQEEKEIG